MDRNLTNFSKETPQSPDALGPWATHMGGSIVMGVPQKLDGFLLGKIPSRNGWWLGVPVFYGHLHMFVWVIPTVDHIPFFL